MEKDSLRASNNGATTSRSGGVDGLLRSSSEAARQTTTTTTSDFVPQWGNRKRLRCMKVQAKDDSAAAAQRTTTRVDRRVVRADRELGQPGAATNSNHGNGYLNLRHRPCSPPMLPPQRVLRNSENSAAMRAQSNGGLRGFSSPDRAAHDRRGSHHHHHHHNGHHHNEGNRSGASSETAHDSKKGGNGGGGGCGSSSGGSGEAVAPPVWPPKFVIALTNKEKEEDFIIFKGSKLPQRPKKRAKIIQRTVNLVCPGGWLCDLTLERYEVREKKISKKRPRGLKAMGNMDSDSE